MIDFQPLNLIQFSLTTEQQLAQTPYQRGNSFPPSSRLCCIPKGVFATYPFPPLPLPSPSVSPVSPPFSISSRLPPTHQSRSADCVVRRPLNFTVALVGLFMKSCCVCFPSFLPRSCLRPTSLALQPAQTSPLECSPTPLISKWLTRERERETSDFRWFIVLWP